MSVIPQFGNLFSGFTGPLTAAASIGLDMIKSRIVSKQAERAQRRLQNSSADLQLKNALAMADYNSPSNMRQRMEQAGYNVGAQMGQLSGTSGQLGSAPSGGVPGVSYTPLSDSQIALNRSAARLNDAKAGTEETTQALQTATASLQSILQKIGVQDEKLKQIEVFVNDHTKANQVGLSSAAFKTALLNLDSLQQDIFNKQTQRRLNFSEIRLAEQSLVKMSVETYLAAASISEKVAQLPVLRSLASYYAAQQADLNNKSKAGYWQTLSFMNLKKGDLLKRQYNWMPYMNVSKIGADAVSSACKALGIVVDFKSLGLTRALRSAPVYTETYGKGGELIKATKRYRE